MKKVLMILMPILFLTCSTRLMRLDEDEKAVFFQRLKQVQIGMDESIVQEVFADSINRGATFKEIIVPRNMFDKQVYVSEGYTSITYSVGFWDGYEQRIVALITCINGKVDSIFYP